MAAKRSSTGMSIVVTQAATINRSVDDIYAYWRRLENLPQFMPDLKSVTQYSATQSHWVADAQTDLEVAWDAEITEDRPGEVIAWRSLPGSPVGHAGEVRFTAQPDHRGSVVRVVMQYEPPAGVIGRLAAKLFGVEPEQELHDGLLKLRQLLEVGYLVTNSGQPTGKARPKTKEGVKA